MKMKVDVKKLFDVMSAETDRQRAAYLESKKEGNPQIDLLYKADGAMEMTAAVVNWIKEQAGVEK